jgi:hypothetical protein
LSDGDDDDNDNRTMGKDDPKGKDDPLPGSIPTIDDAEALGKASLEVISLIKLPPYQGPHSPLDLVPSEIVFYRLFESFHQMSWDKTNDPTASVGTNSQPPKKAHGTLATRKILVANYVFSYS